MKFDPSPAQDLEADLWLHVQLPFSCVLQEFPNKIGHHMVEPASSLSPSSLTPSFYGCYDWHSAVHGHWGIARAARLIMDPQKRETLIMRLKENLTDENLKQEATYVRQNPSFEMPYGRAWFLQLTAEMHEWAKSDEASCDFARALLPALEDLERQSAQQMMSWATKVSHPIRTGEHSQSAFAFGLCLDWASSLLNCSENDSLVELAKQCQGVLSQRVRDFYQNDPPAVFKLEPSGHDFLSPSLAVADLLRRVMSEDEYSAFVQSYFGDLSVVGLDEQLPLVRSVDCSDGKLNHFNGLSLSRAWMMRGIASALPAGHPCRMAFIDASVKHGELGLLVAQDPDYMGTHWLGSFAIYYLSDRGIY